MDFFHGLNMDNLPSTLACVSMLTLKFSDCQYYISTIVLVVLAAASSSPLNQYPYDQIIDKWLAQYSPTLVDEDIYICMYISSSAGKT